MTERGSIPADIVHNARQMADDAVCHLEEKMHPKGAKQSLPASARASLRSFIETQTVILLHGERQRGATLAGAACAAVIREMGTELRVRGKAAGLR